MADSTNRLGLFGGSFDPVHHAHLWIALNAIEQLELDRLIFIPAAQSPFKPERRPTENRHRLAMLRSALCGQSRISIDDREAERGGLSYSIETVRAYRKRYPEAKLFYLIGADHVTTLPKWRAAPELAELVTFVATPRPGAAWASATPAGFRIRYLEGPSINLSSSEIRQRIAEGPFWRELMPSAVASYIDSHHLYR